MKELSRHIEVLLLENDCVIVPGLGGFIAHNKAAEFKDSANIFCPPLRTIGFNPQLTINDGLLAQSYMQSYDTDFPDASRKIESVVSQIKDSLYKNGQAELDNIGTLYYTMAGTYGFEPYGNAFFSPSLYGLGSFSISPLSELASVKESAAEQRIVIETVPSSVESPKEKNKQHPVYRLFTTRTNTIRKHHQRGKISDELREQALYVAECLRDKALMDNDYAANGYAQDMEQEHVYAEARKRLK